MKIHHFYLSTCLKIFCDALHSTFIEHRATVGISIQEKAQAVIDIDNFTEKLFAEVTSPWKLQHIRCLKCVQHRITSNWQQRRVSKFNKSL